MAGAVYFYHMTRTPLEATLPAILHKSLEAGWRVVVRGTDRAALERLDQRLWLGADESFLPHGLSGGPHDSDQPILLTQSRADALNGANALIAIDGAGVDIDELDGLERASILFDGADQRALETARDQWRTLTGAGARALYWSQESGRWQKKAEA